MEFTLPDFHGRFILESQKFRGFSAFWEAAKEEKGLYAKEIRSGGSKQSFGMFHAYVGTTLAEYARWIDGLSPDLQIDAERSYNEALKEYQDWLRVFVPKSISPLERLLEFQERDDLGEITTADLEKFVLRFKGQSNIEVFRQTCLGDTLSEGGRKKRVLDAVKRVAPLLVQYKVLSCEEIQKAGIKVNLTP